MNPSAVFYESFGGNGVLCNPEALFRTLIADPEFGHLTHVWALTSTSANQSVVREFAEDSRVRFVRPGSSGYYQAMATSGYLINNATFPPEFGKREGQVYLNTWHGTPLKKMGYDVGDPASRVANVVRNFLNADYLLSASAFMTEQMYEGAHLLRQIYRGRIIEEGFPRIDRQFQGDADRKSTRDRLEAAGLPIGDRRIILYAPTWKGTNFSRPEDDAHELIDRVTELNSRIDTDRYVVLLKTHQAVHRFAAHRPHVTPHLVPNELPTNVVLGVTDILVTDYSSIFFDFLATGRPIAFLTPDIDDYAGYRGLYLEPEALPGPVVRTVPELAQELISLGRGEPSPELDQRYRAARDRFVPYEDGGAAARIVDIVFRQRENGYRVLRATRDDRKSILIHAGGMRPNGITASLLSLLDAIDYSRFDVTVLYPRSSNRLIEAKQAEINPRVRQLARVGGMNGSKIGGVARRLSVRRGDVRSHSRNPRQRMLWDDEWTRCFGSSLFDYAVDFSGYGPLGATLLLHAPGAERSIWLHNDMAADAHRVIRGRRRYLHNLSSVFSLYSDYDHLVSVSRSLAEINAHNLTRYAEPGKFTSAANLANTERVVAAAAVDLRIATADPETGIVPAWASTLAESNPVTTFVTVGRISPEKNQARLIRAFALAHAERPDTRLIVVGTGPLESELAELVDRLGLAESVWLVGHQSNPYAVMARCDCFVLSSDYEGQPMVLLEACILDLPVVTVAFGSVADSLPEGSGLVVPATDADLARGMLEFVDGRVSTGGRFDAAAYNQRAVTEFYAAVGITGAEALG